MNPAIATALAPAALLIVVTAAVYTDLLRQRIPNAVSLGGLAAGITLTAQSGGMAGLASALLGAGVGLAFFLPFHLGKGMGAGDVKLMAAVGSFVGPLSAALAAGTALAVGAVLAVGYVAWAQLRPTTAADRVGDLVGSGGRATIAMTRRQRFPYATAIAAGAIVASVHGGQLRPLLTILNGGA